jgi:hypothetical protein
MLCSVCNPTLLSHLPPRLLPRSQPCRFLRDRRVRRFSQQISWKPFLELENVLLGRLARPQELSWWNGLKSVLRL